MDANELRGEATATVGGIEIDLVVTMDGLARLSTALDHPTMPTLWRRLQGSEIVAVKAAIRHFTVSGRRSSGETLKPVEAAQEAIGGLDFLECLQLGPVFGQLFQALLRKSPVAEEAGTREAPPDPKP